MESLLGQALSLSPRFRNLTASLVVLAGMLGTTALSWAQGCPFCYNAAAATRAGGVAALRNGILILMIPPVLIVGLVCLMGIRRYRRDSLAEMGIDVAGSEGGQGILSESRAFSEGTPLISSQQVGTR